jgi:hypothetical protein
MSANIRKTGQGQQELRPQLDRPGTILPVVRELTQYKRMILESIWECAKGYRYGYSHGV